MKKKIAHLLLLSALVVATATNTKAQSVSIGETEFTPNAGAMLEIRSNSKGVLIPRMTYTQRMYIATNAESAGLMVYQTDQTQGFYYFDGLVWKYINPYTAPQPGEPAVPGGNFSGSYNDLTDKPAIPTRLQDLEQDPNYYTTVSRAEREAWNAAAAAAGSGGTTPLAPVATSGSYKDLTDTPIVPTRLQDLQQDENYYTTVSRAEREAWNAKSSFTGNYKDLQDKPAIPTRLQDLEQDPNYFTTVSRQEREAWNAAAEASTFSGSWNDLKNKPFIPENLSDLATDATHQTVTATQKTQWDAAAAGATFSGSYNDLTNKPAFAPVATSGSYADLTEKPAIPTQLGQLESNDLNRTVTTAEKTLWNDVAAIVASGGGGGGGTNPDLLATVAVTGSYNDLNDKPTIITQLRHMEQDDLYAMYVNRAEKDRWDEAANNTISSADRDNWNAKANSNAATTDSHGLMSANDKAKLDGIEAEANAYTHPDSHSPNVIAEDEMKSFVHFGEREKWDNAATTIAQQQQALHRVATSGSYPDLENKPTSIADISQTEASRLPTTQQIVGWEAAATTNAEWATGRTSPAELIGKVNEHIVHPIPTYATATTDGLIMAADYNKIQAAHEYITNPPASTGENGGLMTAADKRKLDGIEAGALNNPHPETHSADMITETANRMFVTPGEKTTWGGKSDINNWSDLAGAAYGTANAMPQILQNLSSSDKLFSAADQTALAAATEHRTTGYHFSGSYEDLSGVTLLNDADIASIKTNQHLGSLNTPGVVAATQVGINAGAVLSLFTHATQAANDALPIGTVIMWSNLTGGNIQDLVGTGKPWRVLTEMQGRFPVAAAYHDLQSNGLTQYGINSASGEEQVTLTPQQMPPHTHPIKTERNTPGGGGWDAHRINMVSGIDNGAQTENAGNGLSHENRPPYYALVFLIKIR
jgi:hypothetical protein